MVIFISQPMKGKSEQEILDDKKVFCAALEAAGHETRGGYIADGIPITGNEALWCLGESLKRLSQCDALLYIGSCDGVSTLPRGCAAEINCAEEYGIPVFFGESGLRRLCDSARRFDK